MIPSNFNTPDPAIVKDLIRSSEQDLEALKQKLQGRSGTELLDLILEDALALKASLSVPQNMEAILASMNAASWLNDSLEKWLGEKNAADTLAQSVQGNITSEMGLALLDVADVIRPYPEVTGYLQNVEDDVFLDKLLQFKGGQDARDAILAYLDKYGMRCAGEIDITRTRWCERPAMLIPAVLSNVRNFEPGAGERRFVQGQKEARKKELDLLERLGHLPEGEQKASETKQMIGQLRSFAGYREYPKYNIVKRFFVYRRALLEEAARLVHAGTIREKEDIYYLSLEELREMMQSSVPDPDLIRKRKEEYSLYEKLTPPRVMTSEGEVLTGSYKRESLPEGAIAGLAVSSGVVEGRARVILNMEDAQLEEGDILVTVFTDPSWTPLFVSLKGLVTEVGGLMTHGAVIAREYGLPAIVGVEHATRLIRDGQRIRVHGTEGYVELL